MAKTNDEIYDLVMAVDKKLDVHLAIHAERESKGLRKWQFYLAVIGPIAAIPMSVIALVIK